MRARWCSFRSSWAGDARAFAAGRERAAVCISLDVAPAARPVYVGIDVAAPESERATVTVRLPSAEWRTFHVVDETVPLTTFRGIPVRMVEQLAPPEAESAYLALVRQQDEMIRRTFLEGQWPARAETEIRPLSSRPGTRFVGNCDCEQCRPRNAAWYANRQQAEARALALFKEWISPDQLSQFEVKGSIEVTGSAGKRYRIRRAKQFNVDQLTDDGNAVKATYCFVPQGASAVGDIMLAQKIALETDESAALAVANRESGFGGAVWRSMPSPW